VDVLEVLAVERAVQEVYLDYCDALDEKRFDDLSGVFTADCEGDYRDTHGAVLHGLAPLVQRLHANMGPGSTCGATHHNVLNARIEVHSTDHADAHVHFYAVHRGIGSMEGRLYSVWGRYDDELRRTPDGWRISRRRYTNFVVDGDKAVIRRGVPQPAEGSC
jgi:3-phenylpropionate/cinnamic acid dioxygenase small subunit